MAGDFNVRFEKPPSRAVLEARARRLARAAGVEARVEWFISEVCDKVATSLKKRVKLATILVQSKVIRNINRPVTKTYTSRRVATTTASGRAGYKTEHSVEISDRSKPGEYPKADTVQLLKTIFIDFREPRADCWIGHIGTPLDYGVILELKMNRSFLLRTLNEERLKVMRILSGPIG